MGIMLLGGWALTLFVSKYKKKIMKRLHGFTIGKVAVSYSFGDSGITITALVTILTRVVEILARL